VWHLRSRRILVGKHRGQIPLGRPIHTLEDNANKGFKEIRWECADRLRIGHVVVCSELSN